MSVPVFIHNRKVVIPSAKSLIESVIKGEREESSEEEVKQVKKHAAKLPILKTKPKPVIAKQKPRVIELTASKPQVLSDEDDSDEDEEEEEDESEDEESESSEEEDNRPRFAGLIIPRF